MYPTLKTGCTNADERQFLDKIRATVALEALRTDRAVREIAAIAVRAAPRGDAGDDIEVPDD